MRDPKRPRDGVLIGGSRENGHEAGGRIRSAGQVQKGVDTWWNPGAQIAWQLPTQVGGRQRAGQVHRLTAANLQSLATEKVKEGTAHLLLGYAYSLSSCSDKWPNKKNKQASTNPE